MRLSSHLPPDTRWKVTAVRDARVGGVMLFNVKRSVCLVGSCEGRRSGFAGDDKTQVKDNIPGDPQLQVRDAIPDIINSW